MPDQLTVTPPVSAGTAGWRSAVLPLVVRFVVVLACFALVGALAGVLWEWLWTPPVGVVLHHKWALDERGLRGDFSGTASYVLIATAAGFLLGALAAFVLDRAEIVTLVAVVAGSVLAGWLMYRVGLALGPPDPRPLARTAEDLTALPGRLRVVGGSRYYAFPLGAMGGLVIVFLGLSRHRRVDG